MKKAELLAPSGNFECVKAAVYNGADAVYLGGRLFNARAYANNFDDEQLAMTCDFCHQYDVKVYVTVNTLYKQEEIPPLLEFVEKLYEMGVDGLIMQDLGAISLVRKYWPDLPVHASTQLTANSLNDVKVMEEMGVRTVVLSRELNLEEISEICHNTSMRVETFIHGALCVSYSGQCFMSSVLSDRSGNRGRCSQNCRMHYRLLEDGKKTADGYLLSTKDICVLDLLPQLLDTGVASLKIEGRMKSPEYVAGVTSIYRKYLDRYYEDRDSYYVDPEDRRTLLQLFNRGNFSQGYLKTHSGLDMMCPVHPRHWGLKVGKVISYNPRSRLITIEFSEKMIPGDGIEVHNGTPEGVGCYLNRACGRNEKMTFRLEGDNIRSGQDVYQTFSKSLNDRLAESIARPRRKTPVSGKLTLKLGQPGELTLSHGEVSVTVKGETVQPALNQPLSEELIRAQLAKMGNTVFELAELQLACEEGIYLNRSALNELRSQAAEKLNEQLKVHYHRHSRGYEYVQPEAGRNELKRLSVTVVNEEQFEACLQAELVDNIYLDGREISSQANELALKAHKKGKKVLVKLPRIDRKYITKDLPVAEWEGSLIDGYLVSCPGHLELVKGTAKELVLDSTGNLINNDAAAFWFARGIARAGVSLENNLDTLNQLADGDRMEILVYGRLPLMITHQCPLGNFSGGKKNRMHCRHYGQKINAVLQDDKNSFALVTDCHDCLCTVYTDRPADCLNYLEQLNCRYGRLDFLTETKDEVTAVLAEYQKKIAGEAISHQDSKYDRLYLKSLA